MLRMFGLLVISAVLMSLNESLAYHTLPEHIDLAPAAIGSTGTAPPKPFVAAATPTLTRTPTPINIGNFVWDDIDGDGVQDTGEPGLAGVTVQLWNSTKTALLLSDVTDANGRYTVVAPTPGSYRVRVLLPASGDAFSPIDQGGDDLEDSDINPSGTDVGFTNIFTLANNVISITSIDAGIEKLRTATPTRTPTPVNIGNFVWNDLNDDGVQTAGEPGVANVTVQLWNSAKTSLLASTVTNSNGNYTLVAPTSGEYRVRVVAPGGASFTLKNQGSDTTDSDFNPSGADKGFTDVITIASNVISIISIDAGLINVPAVIPSPTPTVTPAATPSNPIWMPLHSM